MFKNPFKKNKKIKSKRRKFEGASKTPRTSAWISSGGDANAQLRGSLPLLRERSRDLRRNNPYAKRAIEVVTNNVVGKGIQTRFTGSSAERMQLLWDDYALTNIIDFDERLNIYGLQRLIIDSIQESGEVLIRRRFVNDNKYPIRYQVLESDFIDQTKIDGKAPNGNIIIQGIEFDNQGKRVAYHLYETHPGSIVSSLKINTVRIPASEIIHLFRQERPGQVRGIPWASAVMMRLKDLDDFQDAQLMRQKIASLFTAFVQDIGADIGDIDSGYDVEEYGQTLEPGIIEELPPGKTVTFADPPSTENYKEFTSTELRAIASGYGITYESLTNDLADVNFSAGRMGHLEMNRNIETWRSMLMFFGFLDPIVKDFKNQMRLVGETVTDDTKAKHIAPKREMIDPTKEIPASIKSIRAGLSSLSDEISSQGKDPNEVLNQISKDQEKTDNYGLKLDSNPKYTSNNGALQGESLNEE